MNFWSVVRASKAGSRDVLLLHFCCRNAASRRGLKYHEALVGYSQSAHDPTVLSHQASKSMTNRNLSALNHLYYSVALIFCLPVFGRQRTSLKSYSQCYIQSLEKERNHGVTSAFKVLHCFEVKNLEHAKYYDCGNSQSREGLSSTSSCAFSSIFHQPTDLLEHTMPYYC